MFEYASAEKQGGCKVCKKNSQRRYVKSNLKWYIYVFWNISMILANVWLRNVRLGIHSFPICYLWYSNWFKNETSVTLDANLAEVNSEPCQTSKIEVSTKIVRGFSFWTIFTKSSILDLWQDSKIDFEPSNDLRKKLRLRRLAESWMHLSINYFRKTVAYLFTKSIGSYLWVAQNERSVINPVYLGGGTMVTKILDFRLFERIQYALFRTFCSPELSPESWILHCPCESFLEYLT